MTEASPTLSILPLATIEKAIPTPTSPLPSQPAFSPAPVPREYHDLYGELNSDLDAFLAGLPEPGGNGPIFAVELLYANGNVGTHLLQPGVMDLVRLFLARMQYLGVQGVGLQISYPLLQPDFPRSDEFLEFFKQVAAEVRSRGMLLHVETGPVFPQPEYSGDFGKQVDYSDLTNQSYFETKRMMLVKIAREIRPDYLSLGNEPSTEEMLTGLRFNPSEYFSFFDETLAEIGIIPNMKVGVGSGTWEDPAYLDHFLEQDELDYINLHIYPIGRGGSLLERARQVASKARLSGKDVVIGESWLYKAGHAELNAGERDAYTKFFGRDVYSFWEPLDEKFIQAITRMAEAEDIDFVSFFWARYLLAYLEYGSDTTGLSSLQLTQLSSRQARFNMEDGLFSPLGYFIKNLIASFQSP